MSGVTRTHARRRQLQRRTATRAVGAIGLLTGLFAGATLPASAATVNRSLGGGEQVLVTDGQLLPGCNAQDGQHHAASVGFTASETKQYAVSTTNGSAEHRPILVLLRDTGAADPAPEDVLGCVAGTEASGFDARVEGDLVNGERYRVVVTTVAADVPGDAPVSFEISLDDPVVVDFALTELGVQEVTETGANARFAAEGPGNVHWLVWSGDAPAPDPTVIAAVAAQGGCGGLPGAVACGSSVVIPAAPTTVAVGGLTTATAYRLAVTGASANGVLSQPKVLSFATHPFFTVTVLGGPGGEVSPAMVTVPSGGTATIELRPMPGNMVGGASGCAGTMVDGRYRTGTVTADCTVNVTFAPSAGGSGGGGGSWPLEVRSGPGGTISPGSGQITNGEQRVFTVTAETGQVLAHVDGCGGTLDGATFTTSPVNGPCQVVAFFRPSDATLPPAGNAQDGWSISAVAGPGGSVSPVFATIADGAVHPIMIQPAPGFSPAYGGGCPGTFNMATGAFDVGPVHLDCTLYVAFRTSGQPGDGGAGGGGTPPTMWPVNAVASPGGGINPGSAQVPDGQSWTFTLMPAPENVVDHVEGCGGTLVGSLYTTAPIHGGCTVNAFFRPAGGSGGPGDQPGDGGGTPSFDVRVVTWGEGALTPMGARVVQGQTAQFDVSPAQDRVLDVIGGCGGTFANGLYTTAPVTTSCNVYAFFRPTPGSEGGGGNGGGTSFFQVNVMASPGGSIQPNGREVAPGATTSFEVTVQPGFVLDHIGGCGGSFDAGVFTTGPVTANCGVYVLFLPTGDNGGGGNGGGGGGGETPAVKAFAQQGGSVDPAFAPVAPASQHVVTVTPAEGFAIDRVLGCDGTLSGSTYTTGPIQGSCNVYAFFRPLDGPGGGDTPGDAENGWRLHVVTYGNGTVDPMSAVVADGTTATLSVGIADGFGLDLVDGCPVTPLPVTRQLVVGPLSADCTLYVAFRAEQPDNGGPSTFPVSVIAGPGGTVGAVAPVAPGMMVSLPVVPDDGFAVDVAAGCGGSLTDITYATAPIENPCTIYVFFKPVGGPPGGSVEEGWPVVVVSSPGGQVNPDLVVVADGQTTSIAVTPDQGNGVSFVGGCAGAPDPQSGQYITGPVIAACTVYVVFGPAGTGGGDGGGDGGNGGNGDQPGVRAKAWMGGTVTPEFTPGVAGQPVVLTLAADADHMLDYVGGCGGTRSGNTFTTAPFSASCNVYAFFRPLDTPPGGGGGSSDLHVQVVANMPPESNVVTPGNASVAPGATASFTVSTPAGQMVDFVGGCGATFAGTTITTAQVNASCTVYVMFLSTEPGGGPGGNGTGGGGGGTPRGPWTISLEAGEGGQFSPAEMSVPDGGSATFAVLTDLGYEIDTVTGCDGTLEGATFTTGTVTEHCTVTATFRFVGFAVVAGSTEGGQISPAFALVGPAATQTFRLTAGAGHRILSVSGCGGTLSGTTYSVTGVTGPCEIQASFERIPYTVRGAVSGSGTITPTSTIIRHGNVAIFTVTPAVGNRLGSIDGCGVFRDDRGYVSAPVTADCTVTARFVPITYTVGAIVSVGGGGTITPVTPPTATVNHGARATFTVAPAVGYAVKAVSGCGGALSGATFTTAAVVANCTVTAAFQLRTYAVTAAVTGAGGAITPPTTTVNHGARATLTAAPATGYEIDTISGCAGTRTASTFTTGVVTANCAVTATFKLHNYAVTATAGLGGTITPALTTAAHGARVTVSVTPGANFVVNTVTGCAGTLTAAAPGMVASTYATGALTGPCGVTATFRPRPVTVTATAGPGGTITPATTTVDAGAPVGFTLAPAAGFAVKSATGCGGVLSGTRYSIAAATNSCAVAATFASTSGFTTVTPVRLLPAKAFTAAETATIAVVGTATGVPASATSVVLNLAISRPAANGFVTAFPCGATRPALPSLSFLAGKPALGSVVVRPGSTGVCLYASTALTATADVLGFFGTTGGQGFVGLAGAQLLDTRTTATPLAAGVVRELVVGGTRGVTVDASAVAGSITVPAPAAAGALTVYPCGTTRPTVPSISIPAGRTLTVGFVARLGATKLCVYSSIGTHVDIDLTGFFTAGGDHVFTPLTASRLLDTRTTTVLAPTAAREMVAVGRSGIPTAASAVTITLTSIGPKAAGSLTVWPCGVAMPPTTMLSFATGETVSSQVTIKVGTGGKVCIASTVETHVVVDANGFHAPPTV